MAKDNTAPNLTLNQDVEKKKADAYEDLNTAPNLTLQQEKPKKAAAKEPTKEPAGIKSEPDPAAKPSKEEQAGKAK